MLSVWTRTKLPLNEKNPENSLLRYEKNIIINHKGTRMPKDGEDLNTYYKQRTRQI